MNTTIKHLRSALGEPDAPRPYVHPRRVGGSLYLDVVWEQPVEVRRAGAQLHILAAGLELESTGRWLIVTEPGIADVGEGRTWATAYVEMWVGGEFEFQQVEELVIGVADQLGLELRDA